MPIPAGPDAPSSAAAQWAFVDAISSTPTVRLDLHSWPWKVERASSTAPPRRRRSMVENMLTHGSRVVAAAYENREVTLVLALSTSSEDVSAAALQSLMRELDRQSGNFLMWRPAGATNPVFFRTFPADVSAVREIAPYGAYRQFEVTLPAEPFAYGPKETLTAATVYNDPAAGSNGQFFDVNSVKGDVETPLYLSVPRSWALAQAGETSGRRKTLVSVRRGGDPSAAPMVLQAESMTSGTDTSAGTPSGLTGMSGGARRTTTTDTAYRSRLSITEFPSVAGTDVCGTYLVYGRVKAGTSGTVTVGLKWGSSDLTITNGTTTLDATNGSWRYVNLGLVQLPPGQMACTDGISGIPEAVRGVKLALWASSSVVGTLIDWDFLRFVPADDRLLLAEWPFDADVAVSDFVLDPVREAGYARDSSGRRFPTSPVEPEGVGFPLVSPGVSNRIHVMRDVGGWLSGASDDLAAQASIGAWYFPRYLYVRPVTT